MSDQKGLARSLLLGDDDAVVGNEQETNKQTPNEAAATTRDEIDEMLDHDPEFRNQVKAEIRRLAQQGYQVERPQQQVQAQVQQQQDALMQIRRRIDELDKEIEGFFGKQEKERDYVAYEKAKLEMSRLQRAESQILAQQASNSAHRVSADRAVEEFIARERTNQVQMFGTPFIDEYAALIRKTVKQLKPEILASPELLEQALSVYIEPSLFKQFVTDRNRARSTQGAPKGAYNEGKMKTESKKTDDPFPDASPEERRLLQGLGLIKDSNSDGGPDMRPTEDGLGFEFDVLPGKRNRSLTNE